MANPFEDDTQSYLALINEEGQYSLWPVFAAIPKGWQVACGPDSRQSCLDHITLHWVDMRPNSLVAAMEAGGARDS